MTGQGEGQGEEVVVRACGWAASETPEAASIPCMHPPSPHTRTHGAPPNSTNTPKAPSAAATVSTRTRRHVARVLVFVAGRHHDQHARLDSCLGGCVECVVAAAAQRHGDDAVGLLAVGDVVEAGNDRVRRAATVSVQHTHGKHADTLGDAGGHACNRAGAVLWVLASTKKNNNKKQKRGTGSGRVRVCAQQQAHKTGVSQELNHKLGSLSV